jgi:hypothetical protein
LVGAVKLQHDVQAKENILVLDINADYFTLNIVDIVPIFSVLSSTRYFIVTKLFFVILFYLKEYIYW